MAYVVATVAPTKRPWQNGKHTLKTTAKIALCTASPIGSLISPEATQAAKQAADFLAAAGHEIIEIPYPVDGAALIRSYYQMNGAETTAMMNSIQQGLGRPIRKEEIESFHGPCINLAKRFQQPPMFIHYSCGIKQQ